LESAHALAERAQSLEGTRRKYLISAAALLICIAAFRSRSFFTPLSDPSVGLYQSIGQAWLSGHLPYTTTWEYRPPGYFAMWAVAIWIFGAASALNALAIVALGATAVGLWKIAVRLDPRESRATGWWAAGFFVLLSPVNDAVAGVAELQLSAFITWSIYLSLRRPLENRCIVVSGLLAGLALQCKFTAIPLVVVPVVVLLIGSSQLLESAGLFLVGLATPIIIEVIVYIQAHQFLALWNANVRTTLRYKSPPGEFARNWDVLARQLWTLAPQVEFAFFGMVRKVNQSPLASVGWLAAALISIAAAGEFYERQFVLLTAPVALLAALGFTRILRWLSLEFTIRRVISVAVVILTFALHDYHETMTGAMFAWHRLVLRDSTWRLDQTEEVAAELRRLNVGGGRHCISLSRAHISMMFSEWRRRRCTPTATICWTRDYQRVRVSMEKRSLHGFSPCGPALSSWEI